MKLRTGNIVWFRYNKYKHDKEPIVLILYGGKPLVHAINFHYLKKELEDRVYNFIIKVISKELSAKDMRSLYHDYIKGRMHPVVKRAYRTYKFEEINRPIVISKGFHETVGFLQKFKKKLSKKNIKQLKTVVMKKVDAGKEAKKNVLQNITPQEAERRAKKYMKMIRKIKPDTKIDWDQFTKINKRKK